MRKLFEFVQHIGDWRVLVQSKDIANGAVTTEKLSPDVLKVFLNAVYDELSKYYTKEEIDQMLATISEGGFVDLKSYVKKSEVVDYLEEDSPNPVTSGSVYDAVQTLMARIEIIEQKIAHYHPEGVTLTVTPDKLTVGVQSQMAFNADCSTTAMRIMLYRYNADNDTWTEVHHEDDTATFRYQTSIAPTEAGIIKYKAVARIDTETDLVSNIVDVTVEEAAETDYYVGWATGDAASFDGFDALTAEQLEALATGYSKRTQPSITKTVTAADIVGNRQVLFLMWKSDSAPVSGAFYGGLVVESLTASSFTDDNVFQIQRDVEIDGVVYHVAGMRLPFEINNYLTVNF